MPDTASPAPTINDWSPLTDDQLAEYAERGYLHLRGLFSEEEVRRGLEAVDAVVAANPNTLEHHESFYVNDQTVRVRNAVATTAGLDEFLDHPALVGPLMSLLNGNVQILSTEVLVRHLQEEALEPWHTDGGQYLQRLRLTADSLPLQVKAQVFLTDVTRPNSGNFLLVPGSHLEVPTSLDYMCNIEELNEPLRRGEVPEHALVVQAEPGDVLLFPHSLWHGVMANTTQPRKTFIFRYGQLWQRPYDYATQPREVLDRMSPRLRRMFGDFGDAVHPSDFYKPLDQDEAMSVGGGPSAGRATR
ncbi:phytanoyl-CoA dioxygenase family protein [Saccharothrix luteola]|uniref:phytanoyl-CoA dioxygenase family protein n=1 Tax=Saccharothrix luteola TaxID=2893018 RepID=UPI001E5503A2|nr:phytanoyl-CoA dioxygenase family protein [Saccharothrix luteola]MCC8251544.1 phytanoyl-CoA dioxygenase family protein [Saccharothrix luteola]